VFYYRERRRVASADEPRRVSSSLFSADGVGDADAARRPSAETLREDPPLVALAFGRPSVCAPSRTTAFGRRRL